MLSKVGIEVTKSVLVRDFTPPFAKAVKITIP